MNPSVGVMASAALVFVGTCLLAALLVEAPYLVSRNTMRRLPPATRAGLLRPQVYLSSRLLSELSTSELGIVVQHERLWLEASVAEADLGKLPNPRGAYLVRLAGASSAAAGHGHAH